MVVLRMFRKTGDFNVILPLILLSLVSITTTEEVSPDQSVTLQPEGQTQENEMMIPATEDPGEASVAPDDEEESLIKLDESPEDDMASVMVDDQSDDYNNPNVELAGVQTLDMNSGIPGLSDEEVLQFIMKKSDSDSDSGSGSDSNSDSERDCHKRVASNQNSVDETKDNDKNDGGCKNKDHNKLTVVIPPINLIVSHMNSAEQDKMMSNLLFKDTTNRNSNNIKMTKDYRDLSNPNKPNGIITDEDSSYFITYPSIPQYYIPVYGIIYPTKEYYTTYSAPQQYYTTYFQPQQFYTPFSVPQQFYTTSFVPEEFHSVYTIPQYIMNQRLQHTE